MAQVDSENSTTVSATFAGTFKLTPTAGLDWLDIKPDASPEEIFKAIGRLRKEARDEIDRLIRFLDESDDHMEREPDGDEEDVSYPHAGPRATLGISEDDEDGADDEPSLGSSGHYEAGPISYLFHAINDGFEMVLDCEGDEHDGREPDCEDEGAQCDDEGVMA